MSNDGEELKNWRTIAVDAVGEMTATNLAKRQWEDSIELHLNNAVEVARVE